MNEPLCWYDHLIPYAPLFQVLAFLFVGLMAALVAWQQVKTAKRKLKLDLFERRYEFLQWLDRIDKAVRDIGSSSKRESAIYDLIHWSNNARYLYNRRISKFAVNELLRFVGSLRNIGGVNNLPKLNSGMEDEWTKLRDKLVKMMIPYLELAH